MMWRGRVLLQTLLKSTFSNLPEVVPQIFSCQLGLVGVVLIVGFSSLVVL